MLIGLCPVSMKSSHKVTGLNWKYSRAYLCPVHVTNQHSPFPWRAWLTTNDTLVCFLLVNTIGEQYSHWSICQTVSTLHSSFSSSLGVTSKKKTVYLKTLSKLRLTPSPLPYFWQIYFWHIVDHVDLSPLDFLTKIIKFQALKLTLSITFWGSGVQTERHRVPLNGFSTSGWELVKPDWVINHTK